LGYNDAFEDFDVGNTDKNMYNFFTDGTDFIANDGKISNTGTGLIVNAKVFTKTFPPFDGVVENGSLDHFKTFIILNSTFELRECGLSLCRSMYVCQNEWNN